MNAPRRNGNQGHQRRQQQQRSNQVANVAKPVDLWRPVPQLPDVEPIAETSDPTLLLRSLGDPPLMGKSTVAGHYIASVVDRAARFAVALAASADLLEQPHND